MAALKSYRVDLGGMEIFVHATSKLDAERKALRVALTQAPTGTHCSVSATMK